MCFCCWRICCRYIFHILNQNRLEIYSLPLLSGVHHTHSWHKVNIEIRKGEKEILYVEFNTPVEKDGKSIGKSVAVPPTEVK